MRTVVYKSLMIALVPLFGCSDECLESNNYDSTKGDCTMSRNANKTDDAGYLTDNQNVIMRFIEAINNKDFDRIMSFFAEETVYDNKPMDPIRDHESIRAFLEGYLNPSSEVDWVMINIAEAPNGDVLTDRSDRYLLNGRWRDFPTMGVFSIKDGKIVAWRDYFDLQQFITMMQ